MQPGVGFFSHIRQSEELNAYSFESDSNTTHPEDDSLEARAHITEEDEYISTPPQHSKGQEWLFYTFLPRVIGMITGTAVLWSTVQQPFLLVQTRLQSEILHSPRRFTGPVDCFRKSWKLNGLGGLYKGYAPSMLSATIGPLIALRAYSTVLYDLAHINPKLIDEDGKVPWIYNNAIMIGAQITATSAITPLELLARRRQIQALQPPAIVSTAHSLPTPSAALPAPSKPSYPSAWGMARTIWKQEGLRGLYRGHHATMLRQGLGIPLAFAVSTPIEGMLKAREFSFSPTPSERKLHAWEDAIAGASYGLTYACVALPFDCVKTVMQTEGMIHPTSSSIPRTFRQTFAQVYKTQGVRGLYVGFSMVAPGLATVMALDWVIAGAVDRAGFYE
ncbi:mitochondrial carrier [Clavulina sp. PMI_390]|nr:mitochondrial carrier [Clavulina sp. PMI_390]